MPETVTARRMAVARQIRVSLAEAQAELAEHPGPDADRRATLEGLIVALHERLGNRRRVVLEARTLSLQRGIRKRLLRARNTSPVWGFPAGYDPNHMGDRCEICRTVSWVARVIPGQSFVAWHCTSCPAPVPMSIPV